MCTHWNSSQKIFWCHYSSVTNLQKHSKLMNLLLHTVGLSHDIVCYQCNVTIANFFIFLTSNIFLYVPSHKTNMGCMKQWFLGNTEFIDWNGSFSNCSFYHVIKRIWHSLLYNIKFYKNLFQKVYGSLPKSCFTAHFCTHFVKDFEVKHLFTWLRFHVHAILKSESQT